MDADTSVWLDPRLKLSNVCVSINIMSQKEKQKTIAEKRKWEEEKDEEINEELKDKIDVVIA